MSDILRNAIISIQLGIEDFNSNNDKRAISAVRNIYSGILLLFKEKLRRLSPTNSDEVLLKQRIIPKMIDGELKFIGKGKKTVDFDQIKDRFKTIHVETEWDILREIQIERNNLEHYYSSVPLRSLRNVLAKSFIIIKDFVERELNEKPYNLLGETTWATFLENNEVYESEKKKCSDMIEKNITSSEINKELIHRAICIHCGYPLVFPVEEAIDIKDIRLTCLSCNREFMFYENVNTIMEKGYEYENYRRYKDIGETEIVECPSCRKYSYSRSEEKCLLCGYEKEYSNCWRCGNPLDIEEQIHEGLCDSCAYYKEKLSEE